MNGEYVYFFYLKGTFKHIRAREYDDDDMITSFDTPALDREQADQLSKLGKVLGLEWPYKPSWKLIQNVS